MTIIIMLKTKFITSHFVLLVSLFFLAFFPRLYKLNSPLADWHSWRQADTASVTREFVKHNYPILAPHYHDLSNIPNGIDNLDGYRMVEFPILNYFTAQLLRSFPKLDLVTTSRLVSVFCSSFSVLFLYGLVWQLSRSKLTSFLSAALFALLPYSIYYGRAILPETPMVTMQLLSLFTFILWLKHQTSSIKHQKILISNFWFLVSFLSLTLAFLLKPITIFLAPVFAVLAFGYLGLKALKTWPLYLFALTPIPTLWWRHYIQAFPAGIPANRWLLNGNGIRLRPAWWRWLFADRLGRMILGYWGTSFFALGLIAKTKQLKKSFSFFLIPHSFDLFTYTYALSLFAYLVIFATGNVQHDYYQIPLIPIISILVARGLVFLLQLNSERISKFLVMVFSFGLLALSFAFSYYEIKGFFNINNPAIVAAGKRVDELTPIDAKVIAPYMGDTAFLFQTNRTGWPIDGQIDKRIEQGASYYVTTTYNNEAHELEAKYETIEKTPDYLIFKLSN